MDDGFEEEDEVIYDKTSLLQRRPPRRTSQPSEGSGRKAHICRLASVVLVFVCLGISLAIPGPTLRCFEYLTHSEEHLVSCLFVGRAGGILIASLSTQLLLDFMPADCLSVTGLLLLAVAHFVIPWSERIWWLVGAFALQGAAIGLVLSGGLALTRLLYGARHVSLRHFFLLAMALGSLLTPFLVMPFQTHEMTTPASFPVVTNATSPPLVRLPRQAAAEGPSGSIKRSGVGEAPSDADLDLREVPDDGDLPRGGAVFPSTSTSTTASAAGESPAPPSSLMPLDRSSAASHPSTASRPSAALSSATVSPKPRTNDSSKPSISIFSELSPAVNASEFSELDAENGAPVRNDSKGRSLAGTSSSPTTVRPSPNSTLSPTTATWASTSTSTATASSTITSASPSLISAPTSTSSSTPSVPAAVANASSTASPPIPAISVSNATASSSPTTAFSSPTTASTSTATPTAASAASTTASSSPSASSSAPVPPPSVPSRRPPLTEAPGRRRPSLKERYHHIVSRISALRPVQRIYLSLGALCLFVCLVSLHLCCACRRVSRFPVTAEPPAVFGQRRFAGSDLAFIAAVLLLSSVLAGLEVTLGNFLVAWARREAWTVLGALLLASAFWLGLLLGRLSLLVTGRCGGRLALLLLLHLALLLAAGVVLAWLGARRTALAVGVAVAGWGLGPARTLLALWLEASGMKGAELRWMTTLSSVAAGAGEAVLPLAAAFAHQVRVPSLVCGAAAFACFLAALGLMRWRIAARSRPQEEDEELLAAAADSDDPEDGTFALRKLRDDGGKANGDSRRQRLEEEDELDLH